MIHREMMGCFTVECDACGYERTYDVDNDWPELMRQISNDGWDKLKTDDGEWEHYCNACVGEDEQEWGQ